MSNKLKEFFRTYDLESKHLVKLTIKELPEMVKVSKAGTAFLIYLGNKDREKKLTALLTLDGELQREDPKAKLRFNDELGFWTIKKTETTEQFLKWWAERWSIPFNS